MASNNGQMHNLTTLIKRLEAATSRLEDMAEKTVDPNIATPAPIVAEPSAPPAPKVEIPEIIEEYNDFIATTVKKFVNLSDEIGGVVAKEASIIYRAFASQKKFLLISTQSKKPSPDGPQLMELLKPLQDQISEIVTLRDESRASPFFNHLSAISESIGVLAWVTIDTKPHKHVEEMYGSAQYWGNRVLKEFRDKDPKQVEWVQAYYQIFKDLTEYVQQNFPQGLPWNPKGLDAIEAAKIVDTQGGPPAPPHPKAPTPSAGGAPPPPPPPPPPGPPPKFDIQDQSKPAPAASGLGAVFSDLNKGSAVTSGLKHVSANEMTHKNPSLRAGATVPEGAAVSRGKSPAPPGKKPKPESMRTKKPPVKTLDGNKWLIEHFDGEEKPIEINVEISQSILISRCQKATVILHGKGNAISIDNCKRLNLVIDSLVSSVDVIKSQNFQLQVNEALPTILMDQVDQATIFLGKDSMDTEVLSSKSAGINLCTLDGDESKETPLPEQIRTYFGADGKFVSEIVEHAG